MWARRPARCKVCPKGFTKYSTQKCLFNTFDKNSMALYLTGRPQQQKICNYTDGTPVRRAYPQ